MKSAVVLFLLCLTFLSMTAVAHAQPREAFEACAGKQIGDPCQAGPEDGQCFAPQGRAFCIPQSHLQGGRPDGPPQGQNQGQQQGQQGNRPAEQATTGGEMESGLRPTGRPARSDSFGNGNPMKDMVQGRRKAQKYPAPGTKTSYEETLPAPTYGWFDTAQTLCFDTSKVIACPEPGEAYFGQDAQYQPTPLAFANNGNGTVTDYNTGLTWEKAHHEKRLPQVDAARYCNNLDLGGYDDWRLPSSKELYSIITFDGARGVKAYLDTAYFDIKPPTSLDSKDRFSSTHSPDMMGQTWTSTIYKGNLWGRNQESAFFVNFLDGRIKCAPTHGRMGQFYRCVRGEPYGQNAFQANGDGTVTDQSSELVWQESDDGQTRNWPEALAYCENLELAGHTDWRLPNAKELQYVLDYSRIPATPKELKQSDPAAWYWTSTTLGDNISQGVYICFGKGVSEDGVDVHGAGAQRSDPKTMRQKHGSQQGGQEDAVRVNNLVRCVRN